jgi:macrolide transport system ATP-binding/permease protein
MKKHPLSSLDDDIRDHIERETRDNLERGMSAEEARYAALRKFGNVTLIREETRAVWIPVWTDQLRQDVRYAVRTIGRAPGFAVIAVGSSALGIGACAVMFAILNAAIFRPLPVDQSGRLMSVSQSDRRTGEAGNELSYPDFRDLRLARSFEGIAAYNPLLPVSMGVRGDPQRHWGSLATANYFAVVKPGFAAGRGFDASREDTPGEPPVVVLSHDLWRRRFAGDRRIVGRTISINNRAATVIGVTAAGFRGTDVGFVPEFWIPFSMIDEDRVHSGPASENRQRYWLRAVARLRPGIDAQAAHAELDTIARRLNSTHTGGDEHRGFHVERAGQLDPRLRRMALALFSVSLGVTALVLLAGCTNVANLLLGRALSRRREIAARMALGASRPRLLRQLLTESLMLALLGGIGGWIITAQVSSLFGLLRTPFGWPLDLAISLDYRALLFCIALSVITAIAFGLVPALRATRLEVITDLKADARSGAAVGRFCLRHGLVVAQVAICTVLLVCMGLFLRSLQAAQGMDLGLAKRNLLLLAFDPGLDRRPDSQSQQLLRHVLERAQAVPGVESATLTTAVPLTFIVSNSDFVPVESATNPQAPRVHTDIYAVGPHFFATMGISFLAGEDFRFDQPRTGGLAIVNDAFARAAFPNGWSPIGRRVLGDGKRLEIVGLVATAKSRTIGEDPRPTIFLPILTEYSAAENPRGITLVVKTSEPAASYASQLREVLRRADPSLAVFDVRTMETHLREALIGSRLAWALSAVAGCIGAVIAVVGMYGVISFAVARRRREFGIRLAIGARPREILMMILRQGLTLAFVGTAVGFLAALGLTRFGASLLYGVSPTDRMTFVIVPSFLMAVALLACMLPARAAARLDPVEVLRGE